MIVFPHAKINLGLHILRKRDDGYHDIETIFYPLPWSDVLEAKEGDPELEVFGLKPDGNQEDNLVWKAWRLLGKDFKIPELSWRLLKNIPFGAGLGGGSADGAFALKWINTHFELGLNVDQLAAYALQLGSDCPFFLHDEPMLGTARGEALKPVEVDLNGVFAILIYPGFTISTAWAFGQVMPSTPTRSLEEIIKLPKNEWRDQLINDFEKPIFEAQRKLMEIKRWLYDQGAFYAAMSGSGSAIFGLFEKIELNHWTVAKKWNLNPTFVWSGKLN